MADGVGGGAHGEIASSVLLSHCAEAPKATYRDPNRLVDWVIQADARVAQAIARRTDQAGAATLAAAWFPSQRTAHLVSVGDCRVYRLSPGTQRYSIRRVTQDQTYASVAEAPPPNGRPNDPARMVGAGAVGVPAVVKTEIREGELLLLCSDGVHKFVRDEQIANVVSAGLDQGRSLETICGSLVRTAKTNGGHDDASALLVLRRPWLGARWAFVAVAALLVLTFGAQKAFAETQSVIDPTEAAEPSAPPSAQPPARKEKANKPAPSQPDGSLKRERQRAEEEARKRANAEARAQAAESEAARLRAAEQQRKAEAAKEAAEKAAARKAAQARAIQAAKAARARLAADKLATDQLAAEAAAREAAARELAARQAAEREAAAREAAVKEAIAKEAAAREAATKEAAAREARELAAKEAAAREAASREAAREAANRQYAAKQLPPRDIQVQLAAIRSPARDFFTSRPMPQHGTAIRDCAECPELVWLPQGEFLMGEGGGANGRHLVRIGYALAVGRFEVTFAEWDACVSAGGCQRRPDDAGWGRGRQPVVNVSWADAQQYAAWLSRRTRKNYRLLTEAEWEYAARAGSHARFWWGNDSGQGEANCYGCGSQWDGRRAAPAGSFAPNPFGLHDMHGNVSEWVEDCYHDRYQEAPNDGRAWTNACTTQVDIRIIRGGAWRDASHTTRSAARGSASARYYDNRIGFRIARTE